MVASTSAPLPTMGQENGGTMVVPRGMTGSGYPTPPASANGGGSVYGGAMNGHGSANGMGSWGRASQTSKKSKGSKKGPAASNASVGSLMLGGGRSGSVSRDIGAEGNTGSRGGFMSIFREMRLTGPGHSNAGSGPVGHGNGGDERQRGRGLERGNSRSGSGSRSSSRSSASTYYVLPSAGQKVKIIVSFSQFFVVAAFSEPAIFLFCTFFKKACDRISDSVFPLKQRPDGTAVSAAPSVHPNHARSASSGIVGSGGGWLKKALTPGRFFRSSSHQPPPSQAPSHRSRASVDIPRDMTSERDPIRDGGVAFTSGGATVAPTGVGVAPSGRTRTMSERSGGPRKLVRRGSEAPTTASAATSAGNAGVGAGGRISVAAS